MVKQYLFDSAGARMVMDTCFGIALFHLWCISGSVLSFTLLLRLTGVFGPGLPGLSGVGGGPWVLRPDDVARPRLDWAPILLIPAVLGSWRASMVLKR